MITVVLKLGNFYGKITLETASEVVFLEALSSQQLLRARCIS